MRAPLNHDAPGKPPIRYATINQNPDQDRQRKADAKLKDFLHLGKKVMGVTSDE